MDIGIAIGIGLLAGVLAGAMGVGGGVIMVPGLVLLAGTEQHTAQGVSLAVIAVIAFCGMLAHQRLRNVRWKTALWIIPAAVLFSFLGSLIAHWQAQLFLRQLVGASIIVVGVITVVQDWLAQREMAQVESVAASQRKAAKVLVVDDEPNVREMLQEVVSRRGYSVVNAGSGEEALSIMAGQSFDLVFLDLVLPGISGAETFARIKEEHKGTVVVIVTGYADGSLAMEAMEHGPLFLVRKPFQVGDVIEVLDAVLRVR